MLKNLVGGKRLRLQPSLATPSLGLPFKPLWFSGLGPLFPLGVPVPWQPRGFAGRPQKFHFDFGTLRHQRGVKWDDHYPMELKPQATSEELSGSRPPARPPGKRLRLQPSLATPSLGLPFKPLWFSGLGPLFPLGVPVPWQLRGFAGRPQKFHFDFGTLRHQRGVKWDWLY